MIWLGVDWGVVLVSAAASAVISWVIAYTITTVHIRRQIRARRTR